MEFGKSEEERQHDRADTGQKEHGSKPERGNKERIELNVLAMREAEKSIVQLGVATHIGDSNMEKCSDAVKA